MLIPRDDLLNLLDRAVLAFRLGQNASGSVSMDGFCRVAKPVQFMARLADASARWDFLQCADILEWEIRPIVARINGVLVPDRAA